MISGERAVELLTLSSYLAARRIAWNHAEQAACALADTATAQDIDTVVDFLSAATRTAQSNASSFAHLVVAYANRLVDNGKPDKAMPLFAASEAFYETIGALDHLANCKMERGNALLALGDIQPA